MSDNCEAKTSKKISSDDDFVSVVNNCKIGFLACSIVLCHPCYQMSKHFDGFIREIFISLFCLLMIRLTDGVDLSILFAGIFVIRLTTLPESIIALACISPNFFFRLRVLVDLPNRKI